MFQLMLPGSLLFMATAVALKHGKVVTIFATLAALLAVPFGLFVAGYPTLILRTLGFGLVASAMATAVLLHRGSHWGKWGFVLQLACSLGILIAVGMPNSLV